MVRDVGNRVDACFDTLYSMDLGGYKDQWVLLINGEFIFSHHDERTVLEYAEENYPNSLPCLVKVPSEISYSA